MAYSKTTWVSGVAPGISAANLNNLETQYDEAVAVAVLKSLFNAYTILYADTDNTPAALTLAASRLVGRKASGGIVALTPAEIRTIINVENGAKADLTGSEIVALLEALGGGSQLSHDQLDDVSSSDHHTKYADSEARAAAVSDAAYGAGWNGVTNIASSKNAVYDKIETLGNASIASGSYTGNDSANRTIAHGLGVTPKIVFIWCLNDAYWFRQMTGVNSVLYQSGAATGAKSVTAMDGTNFHVGNATSYQQSANVNTNSYNWVAIG